MKKALIVLLLSFVLFGCTEKEYKTKHLIYKSRKTNYIIYAFVHGKSDNSKEIDVPVNFADAYQGSREIFDLNFACGEDGSAVAFDADGIVRYQKYEFGNTVKGKYEKVGENVYALAFEDREEIEYFVFNQDTLMAYFHLDNSLSIGELNEYSSGTRITGCGIVNKNGEVVSQSYPEE